MGATAIQNQVIDNKEWRDLFWYVVEELKKQDAKYQDCPRMPTSILFKATRITEKSAGKLPKSDDDIKAEIIV